MAIQNATQALQKTLALGNQIYVGLGDGSLSKSQLEELQRDMVNTIRPLLKVGFPMPGLLDFLGGKVPSRTVALYRALQDVCGEAIGVEPPLIIQLTLKGQETQTFISPVS